MEIAQASAVAEDTKAALASAEEELSAKNTLIEELKSQLEIAQDSAIGEETMAELASAQAELASQAKAMEGLMSKLAVAEEAAESELEELREQLRSVSDQRAQVDRLVSELADKEVEISHLKTSQSILASEHRSSQETLQLELDNLKRLVADRDAVTDNNQSSDEDKELIVEMQAKLEEWSVWASEMTSELSEKEQQLVAALRLKTELETSAQLVEELRSQLAIAEAETALARDGDAKLDFDLMNQQLESLRAELVVAKSQVPSESPEIAELEQKLTEWSAWGASMTDELRLRDDQLEVNQRATEALKQQLAAAEEERARVRQELETVSDTLAEVRLDSELKPLQATDAQLRILQEENDLLKLQIESLSNSLSDVSPRAAEEKLREWELWAIEMSSTLAERDDVISKLQSATQNDGETAEALAYMTTERDSALSRIHALEKELRDAQAGDETDSDLRKLKSQLIVREATIKSLISQAAPIKPLTSQVAPVVDDHQSLAEANEEIQILKDKVAELIQRQDQEDIERVAEEATLLTAYREEIERLSRENSEMRSKMSRSPNSGNSWWKSPFVAESTPAVTPRDPPAL